MFYNMHIQISNASPEALIPNSVSSDVLSPKTLSTAAVTRVEAAGNVVAGVAAKGVEAVLPLLYPAGVLGLTIFGIRKMIDGVLGKSSGSAKTIG
jgi:hypothetical protein